MYCINKYPLQFYLFILSTFLNTWSYSIEENILIYKLQIQKSVRQATNTNKVQQETLTA